MRVLLAAFIATFALTATAPASLAQPREGFGELAEQLSPAVVNISAAQRMRTDDNLPTFPPGSPLERFNDLLGDNPRVASSLGSGFIIDPSGLVVTNNHVIEEADEVEVVLTDGRTLPADIVGVDPATDLAVLRIREGNGTFPFVRFGDSDAARVGDWVIAIGNPFGLGGSLTAGVISARGREIGGRYDDYLQTDVAINRGNSGGPLFDMEGRVVGVNTAIFSPTGASVGISFSIPSNIAAPIVRQLGEFGETRRGWLGVNVQAVTADTAEALGLSSPRGAIVSRVDVDGPAYAAGVERGDLILAFNGEAVPDDRRLPRMVADTPVGTRASLDVLRRGEPLTLEVEVARLDEPDAAPPRPVGTQDDVPGTTPSSRTLFGLTLAPITDALRRTHRLHPDARGLVVTAVEPGSDAAGKVRVGDVVEEIAWTIVESVDEARQIARSAAGETGRPVLFSLNRQGQFVLQSLRP